ncbi:hypothetical protein ACMU_04980 [Actibacterium mucosum KCTC 23349]|uniref:DNA 3'-5' helicase II n=1 Tax=Actibacterium mucosum KCTC 23349 TaxID=1454373 RepID=A0A037ZL89_9RHOB|nr:hypothetical protein ACMU_04980 [Actibacterium mucosum KCTC 23349]
MESLARISEKARVALTDARRNPASALAQINTLNDGQAIGAGAGISQDLAEGYQRLVIEPALARVSVVDEDGNEKTFYFARQSTVSGISNFASYKAPIGRLASQDIGDTYSLPNGVEVEVTEKLILHPLQVDGDWDSERTRAFFEDAPASLIASLRDLLTKSPKDKDDYDPFADWDSEHSGISDDLHREVLRGISLRDQAILDKTQDELFRMPLQARLMLKGPPGTGKTTTLIRRLGQKLQLPEEMAEDIGTVRQARSLNEIEHKDSWLMFTPTRLLELYLREAFGKEGVPSDNSKIVTWEAFREPVSKNHFRLLRSGSSGGGFVLRPSVRHETDQARNDMIGWYEDFDAWQKKTFFTQLVEASKSVALSEQEHLQTIANSAFQALGGKEEGSLLPVFVDLQEIAESLQLWIGERRSAIRGRLDRHLRGQINRDRSFAGQFLHQIESLEREVENDPDEEDLLPDEDIARPTSRGEQIAFSTFRRAMQAFSRSVAQSRTLPKGSRNAHLLEWLGERALPRDEARQIGQELLLMSQVSLLADPVNRYFRGFSQRYRAFRRENLEGWYAPEGLEASALSSHELDLLFLAYLKSANNLLARQAVSRGIESRYWTRLRDVAELFRNQIVVDEVTDFSPLQLASMYELAHPDIHSFFACGDFNQRLTRFGASSEDQLRWAIPQIELKAVNVGYRQSQRLAEFSHDLLLAMSGEETEVHAPQFGSHTGVQPVLFEGGSDTDETSKWLSARILEIERSIETLPSCAVFVPDESNVQPVAESLNMLLEPVNIRAKACPNGEVIGRETEVRVFAIEHIKGLEFESAFFVGLDVLAYNEPDLFDKYLYVGATRAATYLGLTCERHLPERLAPLRDRFVEQWAS